MDTYTFATSAQVDLPISLKICNLEGKQKPIPFSVLIKNPELRHLGSNQSPISDLFITVQLWASSKPLGVPIQTAYKAFKTRGRGARAPGKAPKET
ncbi:phosphoinositide 3-kinase [Histoplasma capsulatum]|uniref:Phosphoinositide 3-kinase n=1 Tax=Ajellomyces capsulatus TaxID=5037 RepID=A0A8A1LW87_AJECA|nr:phosphoinositide 3-kinase [Histoplasma capsulatum]